MESVEPLPLREALPPILEFYGHLLGYCAVLGLIYLFTVRCAERFEEKPPTERPVLSTDLMQEMSDAEDDSDEVEPAKDEPIEEIDTDNMLKADGSKNEKAHPAPKKAAPKPTPGAFPKELNPLTYQPKEDENVSFVDLHNAMLNRYKQKYPEHGPNVAGPAVDDDYDDEMKELMAKHLPEELRQRRAKKP
ncbi:hypothetical protein SPRG_14054 [Saprolegnia parasitica CBS 223.65]|uniref:Uncharacterized protein n=1 Tax=Saprolegnia parasitica (strain CBS 223.65) TaxID=695850 RepID=A0A067C2C2_SAPPC|nr:hypothetical protein SPRG_14054 [Saprolegnia parasitica CBS 223.65]KDO20962.1 hypothetical protein SPRG_14054 [Saprolegnia parasitica CBS 223.65]|eukprot:XP_012208352.1 hypothetical protein SPRG_14054 [Saprolegnia parasitica CBS 223.65]